MSSISEIGHAKNVANFEDLISFCVGYGATYNPILNAIKVANMNTLKTNASSSLTSAITASTAFKNATNSREIVFEPVKKLVTKVMAALKSCGATQQTIDDATTINHKIQGKRAKLKTVFGGREATNPNDPPVEVPTGPKQISVSQQSYDSMIEHMEKLINLLTSIPAYSPNEAELKIASLNTLLASMKTSNTAVINAYTTWSNARIIRDDLLYRKITGLVDVALECKNYVKSIYGATSSQYKQVSKLKFKKMK